MSEKIVLKNVRLSYPHLFEPESFEGQDPKYGCVLIIRADDKQIESLEQTVYKVGREKFGDKIKNTWPSNLHYPIKNGDDRADTNPEYEGCVYINATSKTPIVLLDRAKRKVSVEDDLLYPGAYVNASLSVAAFDAGMKKGVSIFLNGIQFFEHGDRLAGHDVSGDFEQLDEDDFDDYDI